MSIGRRIIEFLQWRLSRDAVARRLWTRVVFAFGKIRMPFLEPRLGNNEMALVITLLRPGDVLAAYTRRYLSSVFIPGKYKHTATYIGGGRVAHAVAPKVAEMWVEDFLREYDKIAIWRPHYPEEYAARSIRSEARQHLGNGYDAVFALGNNLWYCHEYTAHVLESEGVPVPKAGLQYLADDIRQVCDVILEVGS